MPIKVERTAPVAAASECPLASDELDIRYPLVVYDVAKIDEATRDGRDPVCFSMLCTLFARLVQRDIKALQKQSEALKRETCPEEGREPSDSEDRRHGKSRMRLARRRTSCQRFRHSGSLLDGEERTEERRRTK